MPMNYFSGTSTNSKISLPRKEVLPESNHYLWKIESGIARITILNELGGQATIGFASQGDFVGKLLSGQLTYQVECLTPVQVSKMTPTSDDVYPSLRRQLEEKEQLLNILNHQSITQRLLRLLEWLSERFGEPLREGRSLGVKLTHQQLAETIHTSRVTVTRLMGQLEQAGKIRCQRSCQILLISSPSRFNSKCSCSQEIA
jgi:CRP-like cAMP-binding protein